MKRFLWLFTTLAMAFSVCAFASAENGSSSQAENPNPDPQYPVTVGNTVIQEKPMRAAAISPAVTDIIKGLGFEKRLVAMGDGSTPPIVCDEYEDYPIYDIGTLLSPDLDELEKSDADVIFTHGAFTDNIMREIQQMGIAIVEIPYAESLEDVFSNYEMICRVLLGETDGVAYADKKLARYKDILEKVNKISSENASSEKKAIYMRGFPYVLAGGDTFENELMTDILMLENQAGEYQNWTLPAEQEENINPDIILYYSGKFSPVNPEEIIASENYSKSGAVEKSKIYSVKGDYLERRAPQMFMDMVSLMYEMYPDSVPEDLADF